jgi:hypothetical protein
MQKFTATPSNLPSLPGRCTKYVCLPCTCISICPSAAKLPENVSCGAIFQRFLSGKLSPNTRLVGLAAALFMNTITHNEAHSCRPAVSCASYMKINGIFGKSDVIPTEVLWRNHSAVNLFNQTQIGANISLSADCVLVMHLPT